MNAFKLPSSDYHVSSISSRSAMQASVQKTLRMISASLLSAEMKPNLMNDDIYDLVGEVFKG
ncbi:hypothetical protein H8E50_12490 [bacterium]|nr:hypothetical protein [bacterium]